MPNESKPDKEPPILFPTPPLIPCVDAQEATPEMQPEHDKTPNPQVEESAKMRN